MTWKQCPWKFFRSLLSLLRELLFTKPCLKILSFWYNRKEKNDLWYTYQHCLIPKLFFNAIAALAEKSEPAESSIITSGGHLPPKTIPQMHSTEETLPEEVRRILYRCDCDCVPLLENQLGTYQAYENLGDIWGVKSSPSSPDSQPPSVSVSVPTTPAVYPSPTFTSTPSPSLFEDFQRKNKILQVLQDLAILQVSLMSTFYLVQTFRHHNPEQIQPISRHPIARKLQ